MTYWIVSLKSWRWSKQEKLNLSTKYIQRTLLVLQHYEINIQPEIYLTHQTSDSMFVGHVHSYAITTAKTPFCVSNPQRIIDWSYCLHFFVLFLCLSRLVLHQDHTSAQTEKAAHHSQNYLQNEGQSALSFALWCEAFSSCFLTTNVLNDHC